MEGAVAIVTGAGSVGSGVGVGKAVSIVLAKKGVRVVLVDIDESRVRETERLVKEAQGDALVCIGDVSNSDECKKIVDRATDTFGSLDVLVNNAAISVPGTVDTLTNRDWRSVLGVGLMGTVFMSRHVVPVMKSAAHGAIVNISSIAASRGLGTAAYSAMKGGVEALTRDMAVAHGRDGIRVNAIAPGHLNTPRIGAMSNGGDDQVRTKQDLRDAASPLGTEGTAWDVAWAVEFLVGEGACFITGVTLPVDGGVLATCYMSMEPILRHERL